MDGYEHLDLDEIGFAPMEHDTERLRLLTLDEAYELVRVLRTAAEEGGAAARDADRLAREIARASRRKADTALAAGGTNSAPMPSCHEGARCYSLSGDGRPGHGDDLGGKPAAARAVGSIQPST
ncbi:DUF6417 family protein [Streptomyces rishiriensis]|uniref:Uncharacterized protein n=1 Tax=Streptomyces rishiriensis TaxID=68264 RepID=A0ABU0NG19_STRRH|nr:DUF6417 family protein [Streptomyces rishiriensis]MDQ0578043.1 hypothetical protein [Streptomyces rishiriensis]